MDVKVLSEILAQGSVFAIETNKTYNMLDGAPSPVMLKVSRYNVTTKLATKPDETSWWNYTDKSGIVVKKGSTDKFYLLCALHKGAGFGSSEFFALNTETGEFDESKSYSKNAVSKFLGPKEPFLADHMTLPIDNIENLEPLNGVETPWVCPDRPLNAVKPAPWHDVVPMFSKSPVWDPEFAPESVPA